MSQKHCVVGSNPTARTKDMESTAYLMALLEAGNGKQTNVRHFTITSDEHPTCYMQTQSYAVVDSARGNSYGEAKEFLLDSVKQRARLSGPNSLWRQIYASLEHEYE